MKQKRPATQRVQGAASVEALPGGASPMAAAPAAVMPARRRDRTIAAIVRTMTPAYPKLEPSVRARIEADTAAFVIGQIDCMPTFLRLPYKLAVTAFDLLPLLRYGRPFDRLSGAAQASYLSFWSNGKLGVMQDFVKLIRSCALMAYFDHPLMAAELRRAGLGAATVEERRARIG